MLAILQGTGIILCMTEHTTDEDIHLGIELNLMSQEQVVLAFRELVGRNIAEAALKYHVFAARLETAAHGDNAQIRLLVGGPDPDYRAGLVDIMVANYATASDDVKERVLQLALEPLFRDNSFYVAMTVAKMKNPHLVGDLIRRYPLYFPGSGYYEEDLLKGDNLRGPGQMQEWLDSLDGSFFAVSSIALQRDHAADVSILIDANRELFEGAAHIIAARHDYLASCKIAKDPTADRGELLTKYASRFVDEFAQMIREKGAEANWLPLESPEAYFEK